MGVWGFSVVSPGRTLIGGGDLLDNSVLVLVGEAPPDPNPPGILDVLLPLLISIVVEDAILLVLGYKVYIIFPELVYTTSMAIAT